MIRLLFAGLCAMFLATAATAQRLSDGDRLWFSVIIEPDFILSNGAYVGGEMVLQVRLISPDSFQRLRLDMPEIEGARTQTLMRPHMRRLASLGSMGYSDQDGYAYEARFSIIPEQSGQLVIPPIRVTGISQPSAGQGIEFQETSPEQVITVHPITPGFEGDHWIVSRDVRVEQSWSPEITSIKKGDTVRRIVTVTIAGLAADDLPDLALAAGDGFGVLRADVGSETETTDDGLIARLEQSWDIFVETEDVIHVDGFRIPYWNPETARTEVASIPRQRIEPLPEDASALRDQLRADMLSEQRAKWLGVVVLLALPATALFIFLALLVWRALPTRADLALWRASKTSNTAISFYGAFLSWGRQSFHTSTMISEQQLSVLGSDAMDQVKRLHGSTFGRAEAEHRPKHTASTLIRASRKRAVANLFSSVGSRLSRFFSLR